jgi:hypothetical protein
MLMEEDLVQKRASPLDPLQTARREAALLCMRGTHSSALHNDTVLVSKPEGICLRLLPQRIMLLACSTAPGGLRRKLRHAITHDLPMCSAADRALC